jgi:hypothetical protein
VSSRILVTGLSLALVGCPCWTEAVNTSGTLAATSIADPMGAPCLDVVLYGTPDEQVRFMEALPGVCKALRDPHLDRYLTTHLDLLDPADRQAVAGADGVSRFLAPWTLGAPAFHLVPARIPGPGISEICVKPGLRAVAINRALRLKGPNDTRAKQLLVNTIAHETIHLYPDDARPCFDKFIDDNRSLQCHKLSYVVGNLAGCAYVAKHSWTDGDWQRCMTDQAGLTPGGQGSGKRDAFGCRASEAPVTSGPRSAGRVSGSIGDPAI